MAAVAGTALFFLTLLCLAAVGTRLCALCSNGDNPTPPKYKELYIEQEVDHFNYKVQDTYMERFLLSGELHVAAAFILFSNLDTSWHHG